MVTSLDVASSNSLAIWFLRLCKRRRACCCIFPGIASTCNINIQRLHKLSQRMASWSTWAYRFDGRCIHHLPCTSRSICSGKRLVWDVWYRQGLWMSIEQQSWGMSSARHGPFERKYHGLLSRWVQQNLVNFEVSCSVSEIYIVHRGLYGQGP
jgi:hypothetical protein